MPFKCSVDTCGKYFSCKKTLKEHERTHTGERPYSCSQCDTNFAQYSSLQKHQRVHDKKKPYQCKENGCTLSFSQISNLIRHQRIHTGEKPYICEECDKKFASGSNLKQHMQVHNNDEKRLQFECNVQDCDKAFLYVSSLKKHISVAHPQEEKAQLLLLLNTERQDINTSQDLKMFQNTEEQKQSTSVNSGSENLKMSSQQPSMIQKRHKPEGSYSSSTGAQELECRTFQQQDQGITFRPFKREQVKLVNKLENHERNDCQQQIGNKMEVLQNSRTSDQTRKLSQGEQIMPQQPFTNSQYEPQDKQKEQSIFDYNKSLSFQNNPSNYPNQIPNSALQQPPQSQNIQQTIMSQQLQQQQQQQQQQQALEMQQNNNNMLFSNPALLQQVPSLISNLQIPQMINQFNYSQPTSNSNLVFNQAQQLQPVQQNYQQQIQQQTQLAQQQQSQLSPFLNPLQYNNQNQPLSAFSMPTQQQGTDPAQLLALKQLLNQYASTANYIASILNNQQQQAPQQTIQNNDQFQNPLQSQSTSMGNTQGYQNHQSQQIFQATQQTQQAPSQYSKGDVRASSQNSMQDYSQKQQNSQKLISQISEKDLSISQVQQVMSLKNENQAFIESIQQDGPLGEQLMSEEHHNPQSHSSFEEQLQVHEEGEDQEETDQDQQSIGDAQSFLRNSKPFPYKSLSLNDFKPQGGNNNYRQNQRRQNQYQQLEMREEDHSDEYIHHNHEEEDEDSEMDYMFTQGKGGKGFGKGKGMFGVPKIYLKPQERIKSIQCQYDELQDIQNDQNQKQLAKAISIEQMRIQGVQKLNAIQLQIFKQSKENFIKLFKKLPCIKTCMKKVTVSDDPAAEHSKCGSSASARKPISINYGNETDFQEMSKAQTSTQSCKFICDSDKVCPEFLPVNCDDYYDRKCDCTNYCKKMLKLMEHFISDKAQIEEIEDLCQIKSGEAAIFEEKQDHHN